MSIKVTITVELEGSSSATRSSSVTLEETRSRGSDNGFFDALNVEEAITEAGRTVVQQVAKLRGDVRDEIPNAPGIPRNHKRALTGDATPS